MNERADGETGVKPALTRSYRLEAVAFLEPTDERPSATRGRNEAAVADNDRVVAATVALVATDDGTAREGASIYKST